KDMLDKAFAKFPKLTGLIMHSDQGWQYQHAYYRSELDRRIQKKTNWMPPVQYRIASSCGA
ncbi:hypothetical protein, partial [Stomatobaculum longum]|uniref:hypothetical protein n=1 Tax=Stomatobaculum longum TaxID=796942 RepID=UPI003FA732BD